MATASQIVAGAIIINLLTDEEMEIIEFLEANRRRHRYWVRPWIVNRQDENHQNTAYKLQEELILYDDTFEFRVMLRMSPEVYFGILEGIRERIRKQDTNWRRSIPPEHRLTLTLKYLAFGEEPASLAENFRIGRCTVGRIIKETCVAIYEQFHDEYLHTPCTEREWLKVANDFQQRWNYPACLGALDGKHIRIIYPPKTGSYFFNYKKYYSIVLMALANANYEFIYVDVGSEGKAADGGIWKACTLKAAFDNNEVNRPKPLRLMGTNLDVPYHVVADNAFALSNYLQKPFSRRFLSDRELIFNYRLSRARIIIENTFGILSSRFHVFKSEIQMNPDDAVNIVLAAVTLHNILRKCCGSNYVTPTLIDREDTDHNIIQGDWRQGRPLDSLQSNTPNRNPPKSAKNVREDLCDYFCTPYGEVSWQYNKIE